MQAAAASDAEDEKEVEAREGDHHEATSEDEKGRVANAELQEEALDGEEEGHRVEGAAEVPRAPVPAEDPGQAHFPHFHVVPGVEAEVEPGVEHLQDEHGRNDEPDEPFRPGLVNRKERAPDRGEKALRAVGKTLQPERPNPEERGPAPHDPPDEQQGHAEQHQVRAGVGAKGNRPEPTLAASGDEDDEDYQRGDGEEEVEGGRRRRFQPPTHRALPRSAPDRAAIFSRTNRRRRAYTVSYAFRRMGKPVRREPPARRGQLSLPHAVTGENAGGGTPLPRQVPRGTGRTSSERNC